jgi:hypothetical protein
MSKERSQRQIPIKITFVVAALLGTASSSTGQYPQGATYVCQTPTFWCSFLYTAGIPNGSPCYCNTAWGPVAGSSINPSGVPNAPPLPAPQRQPRAGDPRPTPGPDKSGQVDTDDCYNGLGNCPGSFASSRSGSGGRGATTRSTSAFASALKEIIEAADDDFDAVQGEERRGISSSDLYDTSVVPEGFESCTLFIPHSSSRNPRVACYASSRLTAARLVSLVADALGSAGTRNTDGQSWTVDGVEVSVDRSDKSLTIRRSRD